MNTRLSIAEPLVYRISRENNIIHIDLPYSSSKLSMFITAMFGVLGVPIRLILFNRINKMDSQIGFEMSVIVVEAIRGRCASFTVLTATVSEIFGGQTNPDILVGEAGYGCHTFYITDDFRNIVIFADIILLLGLNIISCAHINMHCFIFTS